MNTVNLKLFDDSININLTLFKNTVQCVISENGKIGSIIIAECQKMCEDCNIFEIKTKFGSREIEEYELIAREIIEQMYNSKKITEQMQKKYKTMEKQFNVFLGKKLHLFIALQEKDNMQKNKTIIDHISQSLINLL